MARSSVSAFIALWEEGSHGASVPSEAAAFPHCQKRGKLRTLNSESLRQSHHFPNIAPTSQNTLKSVKMNVAAEGNYSYII